MKSLKAAAVLAGSLIAAGAAGPAFAADMATTGFSGNVNTQLPLELPLHQEQLGTGKEPLVHTAKDAANALNEARPLHHMAKDATTAVQDVKPLHGGLQL
jgi:hypothetical protein